MKETNIYLTNTLTGKKEEFGPVEKGVVKMYHCGPTVYNFPSIGNMRSYILADILRRMFEYFGFRIEQVINITDVGHLVGDGDDGEDKVEKRAKKEGKSAEEIALFYENAFYKDLEELNINTLGTKFPRASEHIQEQLDIIKILEEKGFAYTTMDGVYFDTSRFKDYGKLGKINLENIKEGARVGENKEKRNPTDFALWKFSQKETDQKRLQEWPSPWGVGFPGWHIECSAMSRKYLGQPFDIHTGGIDHIPVHHNNEIAQSESAFGLPLANFWIHNEFLKVDGEKMSKSLDNTYTLNDLKERKIHPLSFRYWLLSGHYSSPMNFTWEAVLGAQSSLEKLVFEFSTLPEGEVDKNVLDLFENSIENDLDTPKILAVLHSAYKNKTTKKTIETIDRILGLNISNMSTKINQIPDEILSIKTERDNARLEKDWQQSDQIRSSLESQGYIVEDHDQSSTIYKSLSSTV